MHLLGTMHYIKLYNWLIQNNLPFMADNQNKNLSIDHASRGISKQFADIYTQQRLFFHKIEIIGQIFILYTNGF